MKTITTILSAALAVTGATHAHAATTLFANDFEAGTLSPAEALSGNFAVARGYMGHQDGYADNEHSTYSVTVDLGDGVGTSLDYDLAFHMEANYDFLRVLVGTTQIALYTNSASQHWSNPLDMFSGVQTIRFDFLSDGSYHYEGVFLGDVAVLRADAAPAPAGEVPEPASWAMMVAGFGLLGASLRTRRTRIAFA